MADDRLIIGVDGVVDLASCGIHKLVVDEALVRALDLHVVRFDDGLGGRGGRWWVRGEEVEKRREEGRGVRR